MSNKIYDLRERIFKYVLSVLDYLQRLPDSSINKIIVNQCSRSVTSIGANYEEADVAHTRKDFVYKMEGIRKEAKETIYWLKVSDAKNNSKFHQNSVILQGEGLELAKIFSSIIKKSRD